MLLVKEHNTVTLCTRETEKHRMAFGTMPIHSCRWGRPYVLFSFVWNRCLCLSTASIDWWWMPFNRADVPITLINWRFCRAWERSYAFQEKKKDTPNRIHLWFGCSTFEGIWWVRIWWIVSVGFVFCQFLRANSYSVLDSKGHFFFQCLPTCYWNSDQRTHVVKHCC